MDSRQFEELVSRWACGDRLSLAEEQVLLDWLKDQPAAREQLLEDEALDSLLRFRRSLAESGEEFVGDCLRRAAAGEANSRPGAAAVTPPPVVAPPVVVAPVPADSRRQTRRPLFGLAVRRAAVVAGGCAVAVVAAIGLRWLAPGPQPGNPQPPTAEIARIQRRPEPKGAFATLAQTSAAVWESPLSPGDRLAAGVLKLTAGTAEVRFDKGTLARLIGPVEISLRSGDELFLGHGNLTARVPPPAVGFAVATSLSRIVDLGTEFDVAVFDSGATQTLVRQGRVSLRSPQEKEGSPAAIELAATGLDHARVWVPAVSAPLLPVITVARGSQGGFLGRMTAGGHTAEFRSETAFRDFRAEALKQLRHAPGKFSENWPVLVQAASSGEKIAAEPHPGHGAAAAVPKPEKASPRAPIEDQTIEVQEDGKTISITDAKESGITVTITESVGGKKQTTEVRAADLPELARKNPEAHRLYGKHFHPRVKSAKGK